MIRLAEEKDLKQLDLLAVSVIENMKKDNIPQWTLNYPRFEHFAKDITTKSLILYEEDNQILGCMAILPENDPPYKTINSWIKDHSIVIHRVLVSPTLQGKGIAKKMLDYAVNYGITFKYASIKIDTHLENYKMRKFLKKNGFIEGDYIEVMDRIAYELVLEDES